MDDNMLEFAQSYEGVFKPKFEEKVNKFLDTMVQDSAVNVGENKATSDEYRGVLKEIDNLNATLNKHKGWRGFLIFCIVCLFAASIFFLVDAVMPSRITSLPVYVSWIVCAVCLAGGIGLILYITKVLNKKINDVDAVLNEKKQLAQNLYNKAMAQVAPLHNLLNIRHELYKLIEETLPTVKFDRNFNMKRFDLLHGKYGMPENTDPDQSTVSLFSGEVLGNPFVEERRFVMNMGEQTYTGSIVITWTEHYTDSQGHSHTRARSETLCASVTKPRPFYNYITRFVFACEAAPDLSFSHQSTHAERLSEAELKRKVKRDSAALQKQARREATSGSGGFTEMANQEFDALFNAEDRDHEVQFRLMFTPLAQKNMLYLMKMPAPYGDDFDFTKSKMLNYITSEHAQTWQIEEDTSQYAKYEVALCREALKNYYMDFFQRFFFDIAPVMSIPLYQQHKSHEYIYRDTYERNFTSFESEVLANCFPVDLFAHPDTNSDVILKTSLVSKKNNLDNLQVEAHSFRTVEHTDYVTKLGGDGRLHDVPVDWIEYVPLDRFSEIDLTESNRTLGGSYAVGKHGLSASFLGNKD